ncbi:lipase family protein [Lysobacter sp. CA199]|uniref:lipase family protein n=1 Tax=Lysobacter sp. CA199 TaxID=3455608 RepID=UPI003F8D3898
MFSLRTRPLRACRRSLFRRAATLAAIALTIAPALAAAEVPFAATPDADPFYAQPKPFPNLPVGTVLQSRPILFRPSLGIPMLNQAWRIQYVSRDHNDRPIAAVATVVKPVSQIGASKLVSYQYAEDSLGLGCAPSHQVAGEIIPDFSFSAQLEPAQYLIGLKTLGWTVVIPDHQGPDSTYAVGKIAGQITLDGIRAALNFKPLKLSRSATPIAMWGYSGGGLATAWAATLKRSYAPELNIVGTASGGTPADLGSAVNAFDSGLGNAFFFLGYSAVIGVNRAYPEMITPILNARGVAAAQATKDSCLGISTDILNAPFIGHFADYTTVADPLNAPGVLATLPKINLPQPGKSPDFDIFVYHAIFDELIPIEGTDRLVQAWCEAGTPVHYWRGIAGEHVAFVAAALPSAVAYLDSRLNGRRAALPLIARSCN